MRYILLICFLLSGCATATPKGCHIEASEKFFTGTRTIVIDDPKGAPGICVDEAKDLIFDCENNYKVKFSYEDAR